ncbi:MAG: cupin domain-containing protein [Acidobacteria bacterium]|nr:cupin domain-containing protein [Acidobacteriota bacterium]
MMIRISKFALWTVLAGLTANGGTFPVEKLTGAPVAAGKVEVRAVLPGAIQEVTTDVVTMAGPVVFREAAKKDAEVVWLFVDGKGTLKTRAQSFEVTEETIARAPLGWAWEIKVPQGSTLVALRVKHAVSAADRDELKKFAKNSAGPHVMKFSECPKYGEAIKSKKTVSRTLLPENYVMRVAMGTVETAGPDVVGRHRHPMLEQLFLGLKGNDITVLADADSANLTPLSILHIPSASMHGAEVTAGRKLHYVWMDFFATKEGQEWLKMHKPETPEAAK